MNKKTVSLILLVIGLIVVLYFVFQALRGRSGTEQSDVLIIREVGSPVVSLAKSASLEAVGSVAKKTVPLEMVDPFALRLDVLSKLASGISGEAAAAGIKLEGIWFNSELRAAFIGGNVVTEGEDVAGWRVRKIYKDRVDLVRQNEIKILKLEDFYHE